MTIPKAEHMTGDVGQLVGEVLLTDNSPDAVVVDLKSSSVDGSVVTGQSHSH